MWIYIVVDLIALNIILHFLCFYHTGILERFGKEECQTFVLINNAAFILAGQKFHVRIHERIIPMGEILKSTALLMLLHMLIAYALMKHLMFWTSAGTTVLWTGLLLFVLLLACRLTERCVIKEMRRKGRNTRSVTLVGSDPQLWNLYEKLLEDPTRGYRVHGCFADEKPQEAPVAWLGTVDQLRRDLAEGKDVELGDEVYVCLSRLEKDTIQMLSRHCDTHVIRFFYVPVSVESLQMRMKRAHIDDIEVYATHESPLEDPLNRAVKRLFDILFSLMGLTVMAILFPFIWLIIKIQSPGPVFFCQERTGLDGKDFRCYKFRSMHVNRDADRVQATKDDPRKFPFGNLMRQTNIDELPQFWNVLKGDMSVVGPRPHMLLHTHTYSRQICEYMVRHFIKPGITGWAQVTGYRGETTHLWQMEERVRRDIWYMEHWSFWLDLRITAITVKRIFIHDKNAY